MLFSPQDFHYFKNSTNTKGVVNPTNEFKFIDKDNVSCRRTELIFYVTVTKGFNI